MTKLQDKARELSASLENAGPDEIVRAALSAFAPAYTFVCMSGGDDSLVTTHWMMGNIHPCNVFHINTGIGIEATREFVRSTCAGQGWPLTEIRAKEDCGQDYDELVLEHGFPGPGMHYKMFQRLKERCVRELSRRLKQKMPDKIMIATGIRMDESARRAGYKYSVIDIVGSVIWVNPFYYRSKQWFMDYIAEHALPRNPVSKMLGMSGECLCGAYAHKGEKAAIKLVCPKTHARIESLEKAVAERGFSWGWEDAPPKKGKGKPDSFMPMCVGCEK